MLQPYMACSVLILSIAAYPIAQNAVYYRALITHRPGAISVRQCCCPARRRRRNADGGVMNAAAAPTGVQVIVVVPPNLLLLDVAGPIEVLRKANLEQSHVRFDVSYVGPVSKVHSSIGLTLSGISPLPEHVPAGALVVIAGTA